MQFAFARGVRVVYVNPSNPSDMSDSLFERMSPEQRNGRGRTRFVRDPEVYAKGSVNVRHLDLRPRESTPCYRR
jgi:hypothetical protein